MTAVVFKIFCELFGKSSNLGKLDPPSSSVCCTHPTILMNFYSPASMKNFKKFSSLIFLTPLLESAEHSQQVSLLLWVVERLKTRWSNKISVLCLFCLSSQRICEKQGRRILWEIFSEAPHYWQNTLPQIITSSHYNNRSETMLPTVAKRWQVILPR